MTNTAAIMCVHMCVPCRPKPVESQHAHRVYTVAGIKVRDGQGYTLLL